jgi:hypothetical protein
MREHGERRRGAEPRETTPANVEEALVSARRHARAALGEAALAARALLDALALATSGAPSETSRTLSWAAAALDDAARGLGRDAPHTSSLLGAVVEALDAEIARWEARAGVDRDARAVLRAYLGLREILWELGLRAPQSDAPHEPAGEREPAVPDAPRRAPTQRAAARGLQRVRIDG